MRSRGPATATGFCLHSRKAAAASTAACRLCGLDCLGVREYGMGLLSKLGCCMPAGGGGGGEGHGAWQEAGQGGWMMRIQFN